jgi:hypothetical protein
LKSVPLPLGRRENSIMSLRRYRSAAPVIALLLIASARVHAQSAAPPTPYPGIPFRDSAYSGGPQVIPGRLQNEYYDTMAISDSAKAAGAEEGVTYHDTDNKNDGSGKLNTGGTYLDQFRRHESADLSYTKFGHAPDAIDDSPFNLVTPEPNSLYLGWIAPGEWVRYTVDVREEGVYSMRVMFTSKFGGHISLDSDGKDLTGPLEIPPTFDARDPVEWRQAHHWGRLERLGRFRLKKGVQVLTLHFLDKPVMNFDYMEFFTVD